MTEKESVLVSWIGGNDLTARSKGQLGPLLSTLEHAQFKRAELLYNYPIEDVEPYLAWLHENINTPIRAQKVSLTSPINYGEIFEASSAHLKCVQNETESISILLSPGTPAMQAVWVLLGKTCFPAKFYQSTLEQGVQLVDLPFEIAAEYLPVAQQLDTRQITRLTKVDVPLDAAFDDILTQNPIMQRLKSQAQVLSERDVPVLIYGETGTGKELFAKAIHNASSRKNKRMVTLNCGSIPPELIDSELFGHKRGAFTGAIADRKGVFEQANGGTLFLDEFGELEQAVQVRLLRVLQDGFYTPVGAIQEKKTDIRLIAATNRNLMLDVADGKFREDLFYRVAVGVIQLPSLRQREGDLLFLIENLLSSLAAQDPFFEGKKFSAAAKNLMLQHQWRGNVRELRSTLIRAVLWSKGNILDVEDVSQALFDFPTRNTDVLSLDVSHGIDIQSVLGNVAEKYIKQALSLSDDNKTKAAELLGLKNYQTLSNWIKKYDIK